MRALALLPLLLSLTACEDRRSFDDRYDDTAKDIEQRAQRIDAELNNSAEADNSVSE